MRRPPQRRITRYGMSPAAVQEPVEIRFWTAHATHTAGCHCTSLCTSTLSVVSSEPAYPSAGRSARRAVRVARPDALATPGHRDEQQPAEEVARGGDDEVQPDVAGGDVRAEAQAEDELERHDDDVVERPESEQRAGRPRDDDPPPDGADALDHPGRDRDERPAAV